MFKTKYVKTLDILNSEIRRAQDSYNSVSRNNYEGIKDSKIHDEMIVQNFVLMDKYLNRLEALWDLKRRIQSELGE